MASITPLYFKNSKDFYISPYYIHSLWQVTPKKIEINDTYIDIEFRKKKEVFEELLKRTKRRYVAHYLTKYGNFVCGEGLLLLEDSEYTLHQILIIYHLVNKSISQERVDRLMLSNIPSKEEYTKDYDKYWHTKTLTTIVRNNVGLIRATEARKLPKDGKVLLKYIKQKLNTYTFIPNLIRN